MAVAHMTLGSATIYGSPVAEIADGNEMKQLVGICPQFNIIFDVLTVEEHLKIFAAIKGILPCDIDNEASACTHTHTHTIAKSTWTPDQSHAYVLVAYPISDLVPHIAVITSTLPSSREECGCGDLPIQHPEL